MINSERKVLLKTLKIETILEGYGDTLDDILDVAVEKNLMRPEEVAIWKEALDIASIVLLRILNLGLAGHRQTFRF